MTEWYNDRYFILVLLRVYNTNHIKIFIDIPEYSYSQLKLVPYFAL